MAKPHARKIILKLADDETCQEIHQMKFQPSQMDESGYQSGDTDDSGSCSSNSCSENTKCSSQTSQKGNGFSKGIQRSFGVDESSESGVGSWEKLDSISCNRSRNSCSSRSSSSSSRSSSSRSSINSRTKDNNDTPLDETQFCLPASVDDLDNNSVKYGLNNDTEDCCSDKQIATDSDRDTDDESEEPSQKAFEEKSEDGVLTDEPDEQQDDTDDDDNDVDNDDKASNASDTSMAIDDLFDGLHIGSYPSSFPPDPDELLGAVGGHDPKYYYHQPRVYSCASPVNNRSDTGYLSRFSRDSSTNHRKSVYDMEPFSDADEYFIQNIGFRKCTGLSYAFPRRFPITIKEVEAFWETDFQVGDAIYPKMSSWARSGRVTCPLNKPADHKKYEFFQNLYSKWVNCNCSTEMWYKKYAGRLLSEIAGTCDIKVKGKNIGSRQKSDISS